MSSLNPVDEKDQTNKVQSKNDDLERRTTTKIKIILYKLGVNASLYWYWLVVTNYHKAMYFLCDRRFTHEPPQ